ncbi:MAG: class I SAM-dependent methyltransferase [bacterium]
MFKPATYLMHKKLKALNYLVSGQVLDIGSGGKDYRYLYNQYNKYITLDLNAEHKPDIVGSIYELPAEDNSFDTIICTQVLEHLADPELAMKEMRRVLKLGGIGIITAPFFNELHEEPIDYFRFTNYGLSELARRTGFTILNLDRIGGFFSLAAQIKIKYFWIRFANSPALIGVLDFISKFYGRLMVWLDGFDNGHANQKFAINWPLVIKKS